MLVDTRRQEVQVNASKLLWTLAGEDKANYDAFKRTELFEFFRLLWIQDDLTEERLRKMKKGIKKTTDQEE